MAHTTTVSMPYQPMLRKERNYIKIEFCDGDRMFFPNLSNDEMYKGMELDRNYTLEELGL